MTDRTSIASSSNLDALRSMAVGFVVLSHLPIPGLGSTKYYHAQALGLLGVLIFFVHTCLVLMYSMERQAGQNGSASTISFLVRRFFRIYPLSCATVLVVSVTAYYGGGKYDISTMLSNLFLIQNITGEASTPGALWSLPYEVQMYLILPLLFRAAHSTSVRPHIIIGAIWLASVGLVVTIWMLGGNYHIAKFLPCFIPGVLAYSLRHSVRSLDPIWLFVYVVCLAAAYPTLIAIGAKENVLAWPVCLVLGLLIPHCTDIEHAAIKRISSAIAKYSFGIYLCHGPMISFAFDTMEGLAQPARWLVFLVGTSTITYLAYHVIESPGIEFGRHLVNRVTAPRLSVNGPGRN